MFRLLMTTISIVGLTNCATPTKIQTNQIEARNSATSRGADPVEVKANFEDAVVDVCGKYFLVDLEIQNTPAASTLQLTKLRAGSRYPGGIVTGMPVYIAEDGIVHVKENLLGARCEVSAYGIPISLTFESIADRLLGDGYVEQDQPNLAENVLRRSFEKDFEDMTLTITLSGNEPGAEGRLSRFSTLLGLVSFRN